MTALSTQDITLDEAVGPALDEELGIVGSGTIACGLAACAALHGDVVLWARSDASQDRARAAVSAACDRLGPEVDPARVQIETDLAALASCSAVVEAVVEDLQVKTQLWRELSGIVRPDALLGSTTSSLPVQALGDATGAPERFAGLHAFNPVPRMQLVELAFPEEAVQRTRERAVALCLALGKTPVHVPDSPGFVVNRLLFPYLFSAVRLAEETGMAPEAIDTCMQLGAGHPMGPLALLDYVGLDVALAIGQELGTEIPRSLAELVAAGALGKKTRHGFYDYS
jgi:3-hydroxybutyryl-CoA dehydrogenase